MDFDFGGELDTAKGSLTELGTYYDFSDGVDITDERIKDWIKSCYDTVVMDIIKRNVDSSYMYTCSGNSMVFVFVQKLSPGKFIFDSYITKQYKHATEYVQMDNYPFK